MLVEHEPAVEADLQRFYNVDYRDRWRCIDGRTVLTLRRLYVLITHLPSDSAVVGVLSDGRPEFRLEHILLADIWQACQQSKKAKQHPLLTDAKRAVRAVKKVSGDRRRKLAEARRRARERRSQIDG